MDRATAYGKLAEFAYCHRMALASADIANTTKSRSVEHQAIKAADIYSARATELEDELVSLLVRET